MRPKASLKKEIQEVTTLVCWCGLDSRGASSLYIATDSRFSWGPGLNWDRGRKLGIPLGTSEIYAFAGDVTLMQNLILGLRKSGMNDDGLHDRLTRMTSDFQSTGLNGTALIFARRIGTGLLSKFIVTAHEYFNGAWSFHEHPIPTEHSDIVCAYGSGKSYAISQVRNWMNQDVSGRTSRSVFSGFCDALRSGKDSRSAAPPQLAGMYRHDSAKEFGIIWNDELIIAGLQPEDDVDLNSIEWRNDLMEICDYRTMTRMEGAQRHARPRKV